MIKPICKKIRDFKEGDFIKGFFLCKKVDMRLTRLGDEYLDLLLEDKTGIMRAKVWSFAGDYSQRINEGEPVAVKGVIISYNDTLEINISNINYVENDIYKDYNFKESLLVKCIEENINKLFEELLKYVEQLDGDYKKIISKIVKNNKSKIKSYPSIDRSYKLKGGLLKQIVSVLNLNQRIFKKYKNLNKRMIISGIIIKNIGSVNYFNEDHQFSVSDDNQYLGYKLIGINIVNDFVSKYVNFDARVKNELQNVILSENTNNDINLNYIRSLYTLDLSINNQINIENTLVI